MFVAKKTQYNIILKKLKSTGLVSRNWCIRRFITRGAEYIRLIKKREGLKIDGDYVETVNGRDFVYRLIK